MRDVPLNEVEPIDDLRALVDHGARSYGDHPAFMERTRDGSVVSVSYAQLARDVRALGTALLDAGLAGRRVALVGENSYAWVLAFFAIVNGGMTVVPLDTGLEPDDMADQMRRAHVSCICHTALYAPEADAAAGSCDPRPRAVDLGSLAGGTLAAGWLDRGRDLVEGGDASFDEVGIDPVATCSVVFTSGTTGRHKGVLLSHRSIGADTRSICQLVRFESEDVLLSVLPLHHTYEDTCGLLGPLYYGSTIAFCPGAKSLPACLETFSPTVMCLVPLYLQTFRERMLRAARAEGSEGRLLRAVGAVLALRRVGIRVRPRAFDRLLRPLGGRLRIITSGGAALDVPTAEFFSALGIEVIQGYGITECSPVIASNRNVDNRLGSAGRVAPCCELRLDEEGQILVRGDLLMNGYLDEEGDEGAMRDGWFATGDLGRLDRDGHLFVTGRCKDVIVLANGENVMPAEIEGRLVASPLVAEAVVLAGRPEAGGPMGIVAHVRPDMGRLAELGLPEAPDERREFVWERMRNEVESVNRGLAYHKRIMALSLHDEPFERTTTMKVRRFSLEGREGGMRNV